MSIWVGISWGCGAMTASTERREPGAAADGDDALGSVGPLDAAWRRHSQSTQEAVLPPGRVAVSCTAPLGHGGLGRHLQEIVEALARREQRALRIGAASEVPPDPLHTAQTTRTLHVIHASQATRAQHLTRPPRLGPPTSCGCGRPSAPRLHWRASRRRGVRGGRASPSTSRPPAGWERPTTSSPSTARPWSNCAPRGGRVGSRPRWSRATPTCGGLRASMRSRCAATPGALRGRAAWCPQPGRARAG